MATVDSVPGHEHVPELTTGLSLPTSKGKNRVRSAELIGRPEKLVIKRPFSLDSPKEPSEDFATKAGLAAKSHRKGRTTRERQLQDDDEKCTSNAYVQILEYKIHKPSLERLDYNAQLAEKFIRKLDAIPALHQLRERVPKFIGSNSLTIVVIESRLTKHHEKLLADYKLEMTDLTEYFCSTRKPDSFSQEKCIILGSINNIDIGIWGFTPEKSMALEDPDKKGLKELLTISFEKEIFIFAEQVLDCINNLSTSTFTNGERRQLHHICLGVKSLLMRKLKEHEPYSRCSKKEENLDERSRLLSVIASRALKFKDLGVDGCCFLQKRLVTFCKDHGNEHQHSIQELIRSLSAGIGMECPEQICVQNSFIANLTNIRSGDKIIGKEAGTLGIFASSRETHRLKAISAGHVFKENESIFFSNKVRLGLCEQSFFESEAPNLIDIALIKIDEDKEESCTTEFRDEQGKKCTLRVSRENGNYGMLTVHKLGSTTKWTTGIVLSDGCAENFRINGILIGGDDDTLFAKKGDSGSIVYHYDATNVDNNQIELIGIVSSVIEVPGPRPIEVPPFLVIASRLNLGLHRVRETLEFD